MMFCLFHVDADVLLVMSSRGKADTSDKLTLVHKGIMMVVVVVVVEEEDEISPHQKALLQTRKQQLICYLYQ